MTDQASPSTAHRRAVRILLVAVVVVALLCALVAVGIHRSRFENRLHRAVDRLASKAGTDRFDSLSLQIGAESGSISAGAEVLRNGRRVDADPHEAVSPPYVYGNPVPNAQLSVHHLDVLGIVNRVRAHVPCSGQTDVDEKLLLIHIVSVTSTKAWVGAQCQSRISADVDYSYREFDGRPFPASSVITPDRISLLRDVYQEVSGSVRAGRLRYSRSGRGPELTLSAEVADPRTPGCAPSVTISNVPQKAGLSSSCDPSSGLTVEGFDVRRLLDPTSTSRQLSTAADSSPADEVLNDGSGLGRLERRALGEAEPVLSPAPDPAGLLTPYAQRFGATQVSMLRFYLDPPGGIRDLDARFVRAGRVVGTVSVGEALPVTTGPTLIGGYIDTELARPSTAVVDIGKVDVPALRTRALQIAGTRCAGWRAGIAVTVRAVEPNRTLVQVGCGTANSGGLLDQSYDGRPWTAFARPTAGQVGLAERVLAAAAGTRQLSGLEASTANSDQAIWTDSDGPVPYGVVAAGIKTPGAGPGETAHGPARDLAGGSCAPQVQLFGGGSSEAVHLVCARQLSRLSVGDEFERPTTAPSAATIMSVWQAGGLSGSTSSVILIQSGGAAFTPHFEIFATRPDKTSEITDYDLSGRRIRGD